MNNRNVMMVWVKTTFVGYHRWEKAPDQVKFLRDWHRHVFHVKLGVQVTDYNREIEFFQLKAKVDDHLKAVYAGKHFEESCEMIAKNLADKVTAILVEVSEDGENGATIFPEMLTSNPPTKELV